mmetsp:Transcript_17442/g.38683  ORF Transcript_17442/g.38683 Transcript_17442/m.38683 type:complete len:457 (-) Transcript_17442:83-1453(-)
MEDDKSTAVQPKVNSVQEFSTDLLRVYYGRLFPYDALFNWLSYGNDPSTNSEAVDKDFFSRREWSFTIEDDIYIRYQSFKDKGEMIAAIQKRQPHKIDIGAVFTAPPKDHNTVKPELFKTVERELVFDIDMTDYDDVRTCCTGAAICGRCWPYMTMAIKVVDCALREDFGFRHILWIYSGRRGVHCWVCDPEARSLSNEARSAVVEYLSISTGSAENSDRKIKQNFEQPHPMMKRAYAILEPYFASCIADGSGQGLLARKDRYMKVLNSLPNESIRKELYERWEKSDNTTGEQRWSHMKAATSPPSDASSQAQQQQAKKRKINWAELESWRTELVFTHCYARLDANVSKTQNHLLKSAFCVHPKTGRVCVPIDPAQADSFDPFSVPTVRSLCAEVDAYDSEHGQEAGAELLSDLEKTSLKDAVAVFNSTYMNDMWSTIRKGFRSKMDRVAAANMDF